MEKNFTIDPAIIYSIVSKQASGLPKGLLELAMNSVDAGATRIDLLIDQNGFVFSDNGKGFADLEQIESCFETFGTPHQKGDAEYGRFRLGRAQIFCYGTTTWHSKTFQMVVDLKDKLSTYDQAAPLGYTLQELDEYFDGCKITGEFYEKVELGNIDDNPDEKNESVVIPHFIKMIKYLPVDLYINEVLVTSKYDEKDAYKVDDHAFYLLKELNSSNDKGVINVYNKGVYAFRMHSSLLSGDIVTKSALDLNMARNEAKKTCPVYKGIKARVSKIERDLSFNEGGSKKSYSDAEAKELVDSFWSSLVGFQPFYLDEFDTFVELPLFKNGNDTKVSLKKIINKLCDFKNGNGSSKKGLILFEAQDLKPLDRKVRDHIKPEYGFINRSLFPSPDIIKNIDFEVCIPNIPLVGHLNELYAEFKEYEFYLSDRGQPVLSKYLDFLVFTYEIINQIRDEDVGYYGINLSQYELIQSLLNNELNNFNEKFVIKTIETRLKKVRLEGFKSDFVRMLNTLLNTYFVKYVCKTMSTVFTGHGGDIKIICVSAEGASFKSLSLSGDTLYITDNYLNEILDNFSNGEIVFDILHQITHSFMSESTDSHGSTFVFANSVINRQLFYRFYEELKIRSLRLILKNIHSYDDIKIYDVPPHFFEKIMQENLNYFEQYA